MAAPAAGLVEFEVLMCLGVALVRLACVGTWLPWVLGEVTAPAKKQFGPSTEHSKPDRAADPVWEDAIALVLGVVGEGAVILSSQASRSARRTPLVGSREPGISTYLTKERTEKKQISKWRN